MDLPQTSPQRERLARKREELTNIRNRTHDKWLSYVAYYLQTYNRELIAKKGTEQEKDVLVKFDNAYMSIREKYESQRIVLNDQIAMINQQMEKLAAQGL